MDQSIVAFIVAYFVAAAAAAALAAINDEEESIPLKDLPRSVLTAIEERFPKARLVSAGKAWHHGQSLFEVVLRTRRHTEVHVTSEGRIMRVQNDHE